MLTTGDRVNLIIAITDRMKREYDWDRIGFILSSFGIRLSDNDPLEHDLSTSNDSALIDLARLLGLDAPGTVPPLAVTTTVRSARPLFIFASHLSSQRRFLGAVRSELQSFGITLFVAHDSIPDDATWQQEIEKALDAADAGLVFLHPGFKESDWCPQEVGWLLGRSVPVIPLNFGVTPYGPLGKLQAGPERSAVPAVLADKILERITNQRVLRGGLVASLVQAMQTSGSFNRTDRIWRHLCELECDARLSADLLAATKSNDQVYRAISPTDEMPYPRAIVAYLRMQPEAAVIRPDIDAYERFLDEQDADPVRERDRARADLKEIAERGRVISAIARQAHQNETSDPFA